MKNKITIRLCSGVIAVLMCFSLVMTVLAADGQETGTIGTIVVDQAQQGTTGTSDTATEKTQEQINDEKINSQVQDEFNKLFPDGFDPNGVQSWIDGQVDAIYTSQRQELTGEFLKMYLNYLKGLMGSDYAESILLDTEAKHKTQTAYYKGDTTSYGGDDKTLVSAATLAEGTSAGYDKAALQAMIDMLQAEIDKYGNAKLPEGYGSNLFDQLGLKPMTIEELLAWGVSSGLIRDDFGYNGIVLPSTIEELKKLLEEYINQLNNGTAPDLYLYKITEYSVKSYTHKHIVQKTPTGYYTWEVNPSAATKTTDTNSLRIMFNSPGQYTITSNAICDVREGDMVSGYVKTYWVIAQGDGSNAVCIKADCGTQIYIGGTYKGFSATILTGGLQEGVALRFRSVIKDVTQKEVGTTLVMDTFGNTMAPADNFTTERH